MAVVESVKKTTRRDLRGCFIIFDSRHPWKSKTHVREAVSLKSRFNACSGAEGRIDNDTKVWDSLLERAESSANPKFRQGQGLRNLPLAIIGGAAASAAATKRDRNANMG